MNWRFNKVLLFLSKSPRYIVSEACNHLRWHEEWRQISCDQTNYSKGQDHNINININRRKFIVEIKFLNWTIQDFEVLYRYTFGKKKNFKMPTGEDHMWEKFSVWSEHFLQVSQSRNVWSYATQMRFPFVVSMFLYRVLCFFVHSICHSSALCCFDSLCSILSHIISFICLGSVPMNLFRQIPRGT